MSRLQAEPSPAQPGDWAESVDLSVELRVGNTRLGMIFKLLLRAAIAYATPLPLPGKGLVVELH